MSRYNGQESTLDSQLRTHFGGDEIYAEFLMDGVLRGAFEARAEAYQKSIQSGWMTPAEVREAENLPFIEGSDKLFINSASVPLDVQGEAGMVPRLTTEEMRSLMGRIGNVTDLKTLDRNLLVTGMNGHAGFVIKELEKAVSAEETVAQFRERLKVLGG